MARLYTDDPIGPDFDWIEWENKRRASVREDIAAIADERERAAAMARFEEWCAANPNPPPSEAL